MEAYSLLAEEPRFAVSQLREIQLPTLRLLRLSSTRVAYVRPALLLYRL
jgi:hypothetical protein